MHKKANHGAFRNKEEAFKQASKASGLASVLEEEKKKKKKKKEEKKSEEERKKREEERKKKKEEKKKKDEENCHRTVEEAAKLEPPR